MTGQTVQSCAGRPASHLAPGSHHLAGRFSVCAPMQLPPAVMPITGVGYISVCQHKLLQAVQEVTEDQNCLPKANTLQGTAADMHQDLGQTA